ncbi:MAG: LuxR C-terminal-related transcriptional regulator [Ilumatobacteraceae bacterium]
MRTGPRPPARGTASRGGDDGDHGDSVGLLRLLAGGTTGDDLAAAALMGPLQPTGADWVALHHLDRQRGALALVGACRVPPGVLGPLSLVPLDAPLPLTEAVGSARPVIEGLTEVVERSPMAHFLLDGRADDGRRIGCVPALGRGVVIGAVTVELAAGRAESWDAADRLHLVADALAVWLALRRGNGQLPVAVAMRPLLHLTDRQRAILALVAEGRTNAQIARELDYSTATVKADLTTMYRLFGVRVRADLVLRAAAAAAERAPAAAEAP